MTVKPLRSIGDQGFFNGYLEEFVMRHFIYSTITLRSIHQPDFHVF